MTTFYVVLVILTLVAMSLFWDWWRSGQIFCLPIPRPYRDRDSQEAAWRYRCGEKLGEADAVLTTLCEVFSFNPDDRFKFSPDDRIMDIYGACYPRWKVWRLGDSMEIESLMMDLEKRYGVDVEEWLWKSSLGEVVERAAEKESNCSAA